MCGLFIIQPKLRLNYSEEVEAPARKAATTGIPDQTSTRARVNAIMGAPIPRPTEKNYHTTNQVDQQSATVQTDTSQDVYISSRKNSYTTLKIEGKTKGGFENQPYYITARNDLNLRRSMSSPTANTCLSGRVRRQDVYSRRSLIIVPSPISSIEEHDQEEEFANGTSITCIPY